MGVRSGTGRVAARLAACAVAALLGVAGTPVPATALITSAVAPAGPVGSGSGDGSGEDSGEDTGSGSAAERADALDGTARESARDARRAAARVRRLARDAEGQARDARQAAAELAAAFSASADADRRRDEDAARLRAAEVARSAVARALYADGGRLGIAATVLDADGPEEALWRAATLDRIQVDLVRRSGLEVATAAVRAADSTAAAREAGDADTRLAGALRALQDRSAAAEEALRRARTELERLDERARSTREAAAAARRLARAEEEARAQRLARAATGALAIPEQYEALYRAAATSCPALPWTLLAAVGQVESGHGRNPGPSSAGAIGPMQFMPATFAAYAVDGDHDGRTDAWDPDDAIWTAARYLCESGAGDGTPEGVRSALWTYNHAQWYVDLVLAAQDAIERRVAAPAGT